METLDFNLQLFADAAIDGGTATGTESVVSASATPPAESETTAGSPADTGKPATEDQGEAIMLVTDPQTGQKRIVTQKEVPKEETNDDAEQDGEPPATADDGEKDTEPPAEIPPTSEESVPDGLIQTTPYTLDELNDEIRKGTVNESRIPQEYALQYVQYRQQQAKQEQAQQAQQAQYQAEQQKVIIAQQQQVMQQIDAAAKQQALQALGITADELNTAEFSDDQGLKEKAAKYHDIAMWNKQQMIFALQQRQVQEQQAQQEQQNIYRGIQAFAADKQQTEPHFQEINLMMDTYYKEMPYKDAAAISEAITAMNAGTVTAEQCQVLEKYYTDTRTHFYAKKAGLSKKPQKIAVPKVEKPGNGATPQPKVVDWNKLGSMTERERRAALSAYWHGKN